MTARALAHPFVFLPSRPSWQMLRCGLVLLRVGVSLVSLLSISDLPSPSSTISMSRKIMGHASAKPGEMTVCHPTNVGQAVFDFLKALHPSKTAECVAANISRETRGLPLREVKADTIDKMLERRSAPSAPLLLALVGAYGPDFLAAVYPGPLGWLAPALRDREIEALRVQQAAIQARLDALA